MQREWVDRTGWLITLAAFLLSAIFLISESGGEVMWSLWSALLTAGLVLFCYIGIRWLWLALR